MKNLKLAYKMLILSAILIGSLLAVTYVAVNRLSELNARTAKFDLSQLEQMESSSVIVDRNDKIFGQSYVENRETIPYDQLPRDLVNAVVAMEDNKFYQHSGYDLFGIVRAALVNFVSGHVRQGVLIPTAYYTGETFRPAPRRPLDDVLHLNHW